MKTTTDLISKMRELSLSLLDHEDLHYLVKKVSLILNTNAVLLDTRHTIVTYSFLTTPLTLNEQLTLQLTDYSTYQNRLYNATLSNTSLHLNGVCFPVLNQGKINYYLFFDNMFEPTYEELSLCEHCCQLIGLHMQRQNAVKVEKMKQQEAFLFDLLYGNVKDPGDVQIYGEIFGWDFSNHHVVIVFSIDEFDYFSMKPDVGNQIYHVIETELVQRRITPIILKKRSEITILFPVEDTNRNAKKAAIREYAFKVKQQCNRIVNSNELKIGIGRSYQKPTDLFRSYQQAKVALELGNLLNYKDDVPFFIDLGLPRLLYHVDTVDLREFYDETIGDLQKYDEENTTDLLNTLEEYLQCECDLQIAADRLFLHKNTLRYRLKKIESILQTELDSMQSKVNLLVAFRIKRMKKL
ncbi:PucR family transcriptional regulator [Bacillus salinus]|uniref:PucR family transcriptional regulator n=1 Tax=Bacillus sp. HMF5848 TaxID=2495421 RepID=UPI00163A59B7|nr:helix-turn-helix domain-containing protein [Bacillus sp. HMF5848]